MVNPDPNNPSAGDTPWNPYGPSVELAPASNPGDAVLPSGMRRGMTGQIQILGVLMILQGIIEVVAALGFAFYALMMPRLMEEIQRDAAARGAQAPPMPAEFGSAVLIGGSVLAILFVVVGGFTIYSGVRVIQHRNRVLALTMLGCGMLTLFTCYCFPTSLMLAVYGYILLLNPPVAYAFELRSRGHDVQSIQRAFLSLK